MWFVMYYTSQKLYVSTVLIYGRIPRKSHTILSVIPSFLNGQKHTDIRIKRYF